MRSASSGSTNGSSKSPRRNLSRSSRRHRLVEPLLRHASGADELDEQLRQRLAAELVAAGVEELQQPLLGGEVLDAPAPWPERVAAAEVVVGDEPPVGADDAVEAVPLAQDAGDHVAVEAEADLLEPDADRPAVVRHDLRGPGRERRLERLEVVVEVPAGIDLVPAVARSAGPRRPSAGRRRGSASSCRRPSAAELVALEAADVRGDETRRELGVLAEGVHDPRPARLGGEVGHRVERDADPDRAVLLPGDVGELAARAPRRRRRRGRSARASARSRRPTSSPRAPRSCGAGRTRSSPGCRGACSAASSCSRLCHSAWRRGSGA